SIDPGSTVLMGFGAAESLFEALTQLAYLAEGYVWSIDAEKVVAFRLGGVDRVLCYEPVAMGVGLAADAGTVANVVLFVGGELFPAHTELSKTYRRSASMDLYGDRVEGFRCNAIAYLDDVDRLVRGLLDDVAYPNRDGFIQFHAGDTSVNQGDVLELRGAPLRRLDPAASDEWGGRFAGRLVGRAQSVTHRFCGKHVRTTVRLTSPLRTVAASLSFMARSQETPSELYQLRWDDTAVGLDMGYRLA
ncbi:MAG: hypothetical protein NTU83_11980, partial [Candidatus Hydrogenedentes bacterium]|nr:hypothetical protein [Candidatus Hydrogenedentota bacterium]